MSLGVHFALSSADEARLLKARTDDEVMTIVEHIEESSTPEDHCDTDKAWDAIHRSLTDGKLEYDNGTFPLNAVILGGRQLIDDLDYTVAYVPAPLVREVAEALDVIEEDWLRERYFALDPNEYGSEHGEDDFEYTWENLQDLREFYGDAAKAGRAVIFTVDA